MSWNRTYNCSGSIIVLVILFLFSIACIIINILFSPTNDHHYSIHYNDSNDNIQSTTATTRGHNRIRILQKHCGLISNPKKCKGTSFCKLSGQYCVYKMPTNENMYANNHGVGGGGSGSGSVYNSIGAQCSGMVMKQCKKSKACSWSKNGSEEICVHSALAGGIGGVDTDSTMLLSGGMRCQKLNKRECKQSKYCKYNQNKNGRSKCINRGGRNNGSKRNNRIADIGVVDEDEDPPIMTDEERPSKFWPRPYYIEHVRSGAECVYSNAYPETYTHIHWLLFDTQEECCNVYDCRHQQEEVSNGMVNSILNDEDQPEKVEETRVEPISCAIGPNLSEIESLTSQLSRLSGRYITSDCSTVKQDFTQYCEIPSGICTTEISIHYGVCRSIPIPSTCTMDVQSVCGCDGITYSNSCLAASNSVNVAYEGECLDEETTSLEPSPNGGDQDIIDISAYSTSCLWHISTEQNKTCTNLDYYPRERNAIPIGFRHQYYFATAEDCCSKTQFGDDCIIEDTCLDD